MAWDIALVEDLRRTCAAEAANSGVRVHVVVMHEPFLSLVIAGRKTVESRFSVTRRAPYRCVEPGDLMLLKKAGGPVVGFSTAGECQFLELTPAVLQRLRGSYARLLCVEDPAFWSSKERCRFATLVWLRDVTPLAPMWCGKKDRRGWVPIAGSRRDPVFLG